MMSKSRLDGLQVISYFRPHFTPHPIHPAPNVGQMTGNCIICWAWVLMQENLMPINVSPNTRQRRKLSFHLVSSHLVMEIKHTKQQFATLTVVIRWSLWRGSWACRHNAICPLQSHHITRQPPQLLPLNWSFNTSAIKCTFLFTIQFTN